MLQREALVCTGSVWKGKRLESTDTRAEDFCKDRGHIMAFTLTNLAEMRGWLRNDFQCSKD